MRRIAVLSVATSVACLVALLMVIQSLSSAEDPAQFATVGAMTSLASAGALSPHTRASTPSPHTVVRAPSPLAMIEADALESYGKLRLHFEPNRGQADPEVRFLSRSGGRSLYLTPTEAVLSWHTEAAAPPGAGEANADTLLEPDRHAVEDFLESRQVGQSVLRMKYVGANPDPKLVGFNELPGRSNYFIGSKENWRKGIPHLAKVRYEQIYPGIDLVFYGNERRLEYDFVVAPRADPSIIRLRFDGAERMSVDDAGNLLLTVAGEEVVQTVPLVYQQENGSRRSVEGSYALLADNLVGFRVGNYETEKPLIIDPTLIYASYLGGSGMDRGLGIAIDRAGSMHITGDTFSTDFPTRKQIPGMAGTTGDIYVAKVDPSGSTLLFSTFIGGGGTDRGYDVAVSDYGEIYVTGITASGATFPTQNALQPDPGGGLDAFVLKLNATGSTLWFSTFLGGTESDTGYGIAVDAAGNPYIVGDTFSSDFPTYNALQPTNGGGIDVFVTKLNSVGLAYLYSTYLGGETLDTGAGIALDGAGRAYVAGHTFSSAFPTENPIQASHGGGTRDGIVAELSSTGTSLLYSTYLGGTGEDLAKAIDVGSDGSAYVTGSTNSTNFPTTGAFQGTYVGLNGDAFVTKVNSTGTAWAYSTYLGGSTIDAGNGIAVDRAGRAHVTGETRSNDFPTVGPLQPYSGSGDDVFISVFDVAGSALKSSTYLGGVGHDKGLAIVLDQTGGIYISGQSDGPTFPTLNAVQGTFGGGNSSDAIFAKLTMPMDFFIASTGFLSPQRAGVDEEAR